MRALPLSVCYFTLTRCSKILLPDVHNGSTGGMLSTNLKRRDFLNEVAGFRTSDERKAYIKFLNANRRVQVCTVYVHFLPAVFSCMCKSSVG